MSSPLDSDQFQILKDVDFDPMQILHDSKNKDGKVIGDDNNDDGDEPGESDKKKAEAGITKIDLSDDDIATGLKKAKDGTEADDDDDEEDKKDDKKKDDKKSVEVDTNNAVALHYKMMVESGEWDEIEGFDGSDEKYEEAKQMNNAKDANALANDYMNKAFKQNPDGREKGVKLFNWLRSGGTVSDFIDLVAPSEFPFADLENEDEEIAGSAAKDLLKNYYGSIGWKKEKIDNKIANLSKTGQLVDEAKDMQEPYQEMIEEQEDRETEALERRNRQNAESSKKFNTALKGLIEENISFGGLKLYNDKKEKAEFESYLFEVNPETGKTAVNEEINEAFKDPKFVLFAANAYRKKLHEAVEKKQKSEKSEAVSNVRKTLEGALLNKKIITEKDSNSEAQGAKSKFQFNLDEAIVIQ